MQAISAAALLAVVLTLCGCGDADRPPPSPAPLPPLTQPASTATPPSAPVAPVAPVAPAPSMVRAMAAPESATIQSDIAQLRQEVASLRRELAELRLMIARAPLSAQPGTWAGAPHTVTAADDQAAPAETLFRSEQADPAWSQQAAANVRAAFTRANPTLGAQLSRIECRSKTCRVEISAASAEALEVALPAVLLALGPVMPNVSSTQVDSDDGSAPIVLYLMR